MLIGLRIKISTTFLGFNPDYSPKYTKLPFLKNGNFTIYLMYVLVLVCVLVFVYVYVYVLVFDVCARYSFRFSLSSESRTSAILK